MVTTTIIEVLRALTAQALRAFLCLKSEHFKHLFIFFRQRLSLHHLEYQNIPDGLSDWLSTVSHAPSQRTNSLQHTTFTSSAISLPVEFNKLLNWHTSCFIALYKHLRIGMTISGISFSS